MYCTMSARMGAQRSIAPVSAPRSSLVQRDVELFVCPVDRGVAVVTRTVDVEHPCVAGGFVTRPASGRYGHAIANPERHPFCAGGHVQLALQHDSDLVVHMQV